MKKLLLIGLAAAGIAGVAGATTPAAAQYYYGPGYYAPAPYYAPPPRYQRRYVRPPRYYSYGYANPYGTFNGCPPHYTIQDGACKPYKGY